MQNEKLEKIRHSLAHIMAYAVLDLHKNAKIGMGPAIDNGFYYDFDVEHNFVPEDLKKIEAKIIKLINQNLKFEQKNVSIDEARNIFGKQDYKLEILNDLESLGKCSNKRNYRYSDEDVKKIFKAIEDKMKSIRGLFSDLEKGDHFSLE